MHHQEASGRWLRFGSMQVDALVVTDGAATLGAPLAGAVPDDGWLWIDVLAEADDAEELLALLTPFGLDRIAIRDAVSDLDLPKLDDFGHHLLVVLHGLRSDRVATYELDCFLGDRLLVTVRDRPSRTIASLREQIAARPELAQSSIDEILALLAEALTRRLLSVLDAFDERLEELSIRALQAHPDVLEDLTAVRTDLAAVRRVVHPQREALDVLRHSSSGRLSDAGRRRLSDVFDVASRAASGLDEARAALAETLDAYRGAEARQATDVTKVLTMYAAIMLPLSLVVGFFGMNFENLPWLQRSWGWIVVTVAMTIVGLVSLGMFISLGWVRRPSGRRAGRTLGRGLLEATRAPVHLVGAVFEVSTMPLRATSARLARIVPAITDQVAGPSVGPTADRETADDDAEHHGSE
jgi:magnesium transporter